MNSIYYLLPFQFERKLQLIKRLRDSQSDKLPNQKEYWAFDIHPEFFKDLQKDSEFFKKFIDLAMRFEHRKFPDGALAISRNDFNKCRFVPEWWFERANLLNDQWFSSCRRINKVRNIAAHKMKMTNKEVFQKFNVSSLSEFKSEILKTINYVVFKKKA